MTKCFVPLLAIAAVFAVSCNTVSSLVHDDEVVAKCGKHRLYRSEVAAVIPEGTSPEDSLGLVKQYAEKWAAGILYMDLASEMLSKAEMDVEEELESYRQSLLKYRFEQHYLNDRLDTAISQPEIEKYYKDNISYFRLREPVVKARYVAILADAPEKAKILSLMCSSDYDDLMLADSLAQMYALKYVDRSDEWVPASEFAREFGMDASTFVASIRSSMVQSGSPKKGEFRSAYVCSVLYSGSKPVEMCQTEIRERILSERRHEILQGLEQDLLGVARDNRKIVIY